MCVCLGLSRTQIPARSHPADAVGDQCPHLCVCSTGRRLCSRTPPQVPASPSAPCCKRCFRFFQGCWLHRAFQRDGLHSERAVQHALGPFPLASEAPTLDRGPRGGRDLLQPGLEAAQPSAHRQLRGAQVRVTAVICSPTGIRPLPLCTGVWVDSLLDGMCEQSAYLGLSCFSMAGIDLRCSRLKVAAPGGSHEAAEKPSGF